MPLETHSPSSAQFRSRITALHAWYGTAMGLQRPLQADTERYWFDWIRAGYNGRQLRKVMVYLRREIAANRRNMGALKLRNLLNPQTFEEDLFLCGANLDPETRLPPTLPAEKALADGKQFAKEATVP